MTGRNASQLSEIRQTTGRRAGICKQKKQLCQLTLGFQPTVDVGFSTHVRFNNNNDKHMHRACVKGSREVRASHFTLFSTIDVPHALLCLASRTCFQYGFFQYGFLVLLPDLIE